VQLGPAVAAERAPDVLAVIAAAIDPVAHPAA